MAISACRFSPSAERTFNDPSDNAHASVVVSAAETNAAAAKAESFQRCMFVVTFKMLGRSDYGGCSYWGAARSLSHWCDIGKDISSNARG